MTTSTILDVTEQTFEADVLERSREVPVVVDFWAEWCGPCRALSPILERLATEAGGSWVLAKIDVDSNQGLAAAAGVQGIPAVRAFKDGRQVAEFTGALPEPHVRQWLAQLGPTPADVAFEEGARLETAGDLERAAEAYRRVLASDPAHGEARPALARVDLRMRASEADLPALQERVNADPADLDAVTALADALAVEGRVEESFDVLLEAVRRTSGDERERVRSHLVGLMDTEGPDDPRVVTARRTLSRLLF